VSKFSRFQFLIPALFAVILSGCQQQSPRLQPLPQAPFVRAYFNQNPAANYTETDRRITRKGDDLEQIILETLDKAQTSIDVAVQELRLPRIAQALAAKHKAGVKVRVILENTYNRPWQDFTDDEIASLDDREQTRVKQGRQWLDRDRDGQLSEAEVHQGDAIAILRRSGIPLIDDTADGSKGSGLMHHKFVIADGRTAIVTSANFTPSDLHGDWEQPASRGNANNLLHIDSPDLASHLQQEFALMWGDGPGGATDSLFGVDKPARPPATVQLGDTRLTVQFSPTSTRIPRSQSVNGTIAKILGLAQHTVDLALFVFSEQSIVDALAQRHQQGVQVHALIDPNFAFLSYSEALDMLGTHLPNRKCQVEAGNHPWANPISSVGTPILPPGDKLHHKFAVIDDRAIVTGSHNWSAAADTQNDETLLIVENPTVAAHFVREFDRLYQGANLGLPSSISHKSDRCSTVTSAPVSSEEAIENPSPSPALNTALNSGKDSSPKVNLNTATQAELETLPGVGAGLAQQIIAARQQQPFASLEDLDRVSGIGPSKLDRLRDLVTW
jgi:competence ComEA-like helix-hairpin-helix protein